MKFTRAVEPKSLNFRRFRYFMENKKLKTKPVGKSWQTCESGPQISGFSWRVEAIRTEAEQKREKVYKFMKMQGDKGHV